MHAPDTAPMLREAAQALADGEPEMVDAATAEVVLEVTGDAALRRAWEARVSTQFVEETIGRSRFFVRQVERPDGHTQSHGP